MEPVQTAFEYTPLLEGEIRLLHLHALRTDRLLCGELVHHSLLDLPQYQTLSYCWGSNKKQATISIASRTLAITQSLHDALKAMQSWQTVVLWADGVCIDQDNLSEKTAQVRQMGAIFTNIPVTVWLGHYDRQAPFFELHAIFRRFLPKNAMLYGLLQAQMAQHNDTVKSLLAAQAVDDVLHILCAPWFQRIWVCQEVILANSVTVKYGHNTLSWSVLSDVAAGLYTFYERETRNINLPSMFMMAVAFERADKHIPKSADVAYLGSRLIRFMLLAKSQHCSNLLDCWYGYQALLGYKTPILLDYTRSVKEVFTDVTGYCLQTGSLDVLELVERRAGSSDLPSWVVNLNEHKYRPFDCFHFCTGGRYVVRPQSMNLIRCDQKTLHLPMYIVDYVAGTVPCYTDWIAERALVPQSLEALRGAYRCLLDQAQDLEGLYVAGGTVREAFWRTLCYDNDGCGYSLTPDWADAFEAYHLFMICKLDEESEVSQDMFDNMMRFASRAKSESFRCFFRSRTGYIGWAPRLTRSGYAIVVIPGARVPYVFEVTKNGLSLVGHVYIHGLMNTVIVDGDTAELTDLGKQLISAPLRILPVV